MPRVIRSALAIIVAPVVAAIMLITPSAGAWSVGSNNVTYWYTDQRWKTTVPASARNVSGTDWITTSTEIAGCVPHEFHYKRYNTLAPSTSLISIGMTTSWLCGNRTNSRYLGDQGTATVFGNFRALTSVFEARNWIDG